MDDSGIMIFFMAAAAIAYLAIARSRRKRAKKQPIVFPDIGSPITSAMVMYDSHDISLDNKKIAEIINQDSEATIAEAENVPLTHGLFPLVRVKSTVPFVVVINDSPEAAQEIQEIADMAERENQLPKDIIDKLRRCDARLDVSSARSPVKIAVQAITVEATTDLDPIKPPVLKVLRSLEDSTHGLTFDCVNGGWPTQ
ncbi:MAG: hypothetical protein JSS83_05030 [Cyanobacteria bacterium SZAS LIN-3]|nr:hypothetical protein [Cyanobacteria bacterium SZAS LIN-3]